MSRFQDGAMGPIDSEAQSSFALHLLASPLGRSSDAAAADPNTVAGRSRALLQTKLTAPRVADVAGLLVRPRLIERLQAAERVRLVLVCAPAGYGKTTLVSQAVAPDEGRVAWLSLDERDNDPGRFVAYLVGAVRRVNPAVGDAAAPEQGSLGGSSWDVLESMLNALARSAGTIRLVVDDYRRIQDPVVHNLMDYLVAFLPPQLRLIVTSRVDPPLPLARLRAGGDLLEIRAGDLSFTREETARYLAIDSDGPIPSGMIGRVHARTEGWIVALHLLNLLLRGEPAERRTAILEGFVGSRRHVAEFLLDEVLRQRPTSHRTFLLQTAILSRLTGPLCDAVTGRADGQAVLRALERDGIPLFALDDQRRGYRYHHLLSEFLGQQLADELGETEVEALHRRASAWLSEHNQLDEAIDHALAAHDGERGIDLLYRAGLEATAFRQTLILRNWLEALPARYLEDDPMLAFWYGRTLSSTCKPKQARALLERAEHALLAAQGTHLIGGVRIARAWGAIHEGRVADALALSQSAIELAAGAPAETRSMAHYTYGAALLRAGHASMALARMERAKTEHPLPTIAAVEVGRALALQGRLAEGAEQIRIGLTNDNPTDSHRRGYIWLADIFRAWNDLDLADEQLERAAELAAFLDSESFFPSLEIARARLLWASDQTEWAMAEVARGIARSRLAGVDAATAEAEAVQAGFWLALGRVDEAETWSRWAGFRPDSPADYARLEAQLVYARVLIAVGRLDDASVVLGRMRRSAEEDGRAIDGGRIRILEALAAQERRRPDEALRALTEAIALLEPSGHLRAVADEGRGLIRLLRELAASGARLDYVRRLLEAADHRPTPSAETTGGLVEPLSNRELEVPRLVSVGLSTRDISDQLFISVPTVKRHVSTILEKLAANSRTQAVSVARSLELI
jgi:LuxR family maltose regulon positive regulatory protein